MTSLGPLPFTILILLAAWGAGTVAGRWMLRGQPEPRPAVGGALFDTALVGLVAARLAFIVAWWPQYASDPWAMLRPGDGGYVPMAGVLAALAFAGWRAWRRPELRRPLTAGLGTAALAYGALAFGLQHWQSRAIGLSEAVLTTLDGRSTRLAALTGKPIVVNLWATWCPPCRREMPALAAAQAWYDDVHIVFANQGEDPATIQRYLDAAGLDLELVLVDRLSRLSEDAGARGLPTTLFFDATGRLIDVHVGELTRAGIAARLAGYSQKPPMPAQAAAAPVR
ncbi:TlpA disulfide reductase family protein [Silanimonas lenta]|uniref:TlpA disulfide reductase family protein n=1 Tax=Silanimonas lenta TaxID=265429 RepID=UPI002FDF610D